MSVATKKRFLIWGKTYPELSTKYYETVCTGGVLEDGTPIRLYPIDYRYLRDEDKFKKYQWMTAAIGHNPRDMRPESYRIDCDSIETGELIPPDDEEWFRRSEILFQQGSWQFDSVDELMVAQERTKQSLGVVVPKEIISVELHRRPDDELHSFEEKKAAVQKLYKADREQLRLFEELMPSEMKDLEFQQTRIYVQWRSSSDKIHRMQIMDWEVGELQRKVGDQKALTHIRSILNLETHAIRFFLGNIFLHPNRFTIVGIWRPKRMSMEGRLF